MLSQNDEDFINSQAMPWEKEKNMGDFLPKDYNVPVSSSGYMKFKDGVNQFRILTSPIIGWEYWVDANGEPRGENAKPQQGDKPVRLKLGENPPVEAGGSVKHFWAMVVYNYKENAVQILQITQKSIQSAIKSMSSDPDWGDPKGTDGYDIAVTRSGEKLETTYAVMPKKPTPLDPKIISKFEEMDIKLEALFEGKDPFIKEE
jgi:hypothetical protein